jgi:hypothetical protein
MKLNLIRSIVILSLLINFSGASDKPKLVSTFSNWSVHTWMEDGQKVCVIASNPVEKYGNYTRRSTPYVWVRHISKNIDEVSLTTGYTYKKNTVPELSTYKLSSGLKSVKNQIIENAKNGRCSAIGEDNSYIFDVTENEQSWVKNVDHDEQIIKEIREGNYFIITGYSPKGTCSTDIYSAIGFTKAYNQMKDLCK